MTTALVSFDIWHTLLNNSKEYSQRKRELIREAIGFAGETSELKALTGRMYADLDVETERRGTHFGLHDRIAYLVRLAGLDMPSKSMMRALKYELRMAYRTYPPHLTENELPKIFSALKASGLKLAVISNTNTSDGAVVHEALDYHGLAEQLDFELYSDELGFAKPDRRIFAELVSRSGIRPDEITHVGDNPVTDLQGARSAGLNAFLYDSKRRQQDAPDVIRSHSSLLTLVQKELLSC